MGKMLKLGQTALVVVDVQGKLAHLMYDKEKLFDSLKKIIRGSQILQIPILWAEQLPENLGPTIPEVAQLLSNTQPIRKCCFSCCGNELFKQALGGLNVKQILITGIETHVCVYQTVIDLLKLGYEVQTVADAVSSRTIENKYVGLEKMKDAGATLTSTETALFELLKIAKGTPFKEIIKIIK